MSTSKYVLCGFGLLVYISDTAAGAELARLDQLVADAEPEYTAKKARLAQIELEKDRGLQFFNEAQSAVKAWASAHTSLISTFEEKRKPDLTLLASKAEELKGLIEQLDNKQ